MSIPVSIIHNIPILIFILLLSLTFHRTEILPNEIIHGKIVVHDRNRVQAEVLPVYFNHASFASLRRQLSYFSFVRVGKSRQSGVTYTNEAVIDLVDILRLKRRTVGQAGGAAARQQQQQAQKRHAKNHHQDETTISKDQADKQEEEQQVPQEDLQEEQRQAQIVTTASLSADVASAVLNGTLHAAKTNHNLDISNSTTTSNNISAEGAAAAADSSAPTTAVGARSTGHTTGSTTQSSISQSIYQTSSSSSSAGGDKSGSSSSKKEKKNNDIISGKKKCKSFKRNKTAGGGSGRMAMDKQSIPRKQRARYNRLLRQNNIVPFIHLPPGHSISAPVPPRKEEGSSSCSSLNNNNNNNVRLLRAAGQKENTSNDNKCAGITATASTTLDARDVPTSDGAINALLALGGNPQ